MSQQPPEHEPDAVEAEILDEDPLRALEEALQQGTRRLRARIRPGADPNEPTVLESLIVDRPLLANGVAAGAGLALGLVVRRLVPPFFRRRK